MGPSQRLAHFDPRREHVHQRRQVLPRATGREQRLGTADQVRRGQGHRSLRMSGESILLQLTGSQSAETFKMSRTKNPETLFLRQTLLGAWPIKFSIFCHFERTR